MTQVTLLSYASCGTCTKAIAWLRAHGVEVNVRPIVESPPTLAELAAWIPRSGIPLRKWMNTSGLSYRALGKDRIAAATDSELVSMLGRDGKLVKRPVLVGDATVLVGFDVAVYERTFAVGAPPPNTRS